MANSQVAPHFTPVNSGLHQTLLEQIRIRRDHGAIEFSSGDLLAAFAKLGVAPGKFLGALTHVIALLGGGVRAIGDGEQDHVTIEQLGALVGG